MEFELDKPRALVVHESMFGNTAAVAASVAEGLWRGGFEVTTTSVCQARPDERVELLVVGGPTHAFSLSNATTREEAVRQGAAVAAVGRGLREWLADLPDAGPDAPSVAVFDTRATMVRRLPFSAARSAARELSRRGYRLADRPRGFLVAGTPGTLAAGELERALWWGQELAASVRRRLTAGSAPATSPSSRHLPS